jgi:hypothetical protein
MKAIRRISGTEVSSLVIEAAILVAAGRYPASFFEHLAPITVWHCPTLRRGAVEGPLHPPQRTSH